MTLALLILIAVTAQRVAELVLAFDNTRRLRARGAYEVGAAHYPMMIALHGLWLAGLWAFGWDRPVNLGWIAVFLVLQALRVWVIVTLGRRWTTRIIILPGEPLVRSGPYRLCAHPNYAVVVAEIAALPLAFGLPIMAIVFSILNAIVLWVRVRAESQALRSMNELLGLPTPRGVK